MQRNIVVALQWLQSALRQCSATDARKEKLGTMQLSTTLRAQMRMQWLELLRHFA